jgi:Resolvase, N terminal domain
VLRVEQDVDVSGQEFIDRPGFAALMKAVRKKQRDFDVLVIRDVDRFGRDLSWSMVSPSRLWPPRKTSRLPSAITPSLYSAGTRPVSMRRTPRRREPPCGRLGFRRSS